MLHNQAQWVFGEVGAQLCPTLCNPMDCSLPVSSVHGIFQARRLEWVAISSSRGSTWPRDQTCVSCIGRQILFHWATWEAHIKGLLVFTVELKSLFLFKFLKKLFLWTHFKWKLTIFEITSYFAHRNSGFIKKFTYLKIFWNSMISTHYKFYFYRACISLANFLLLKIFLFWTFKDYT